MTAAIRVVVVDDSPTVCRLLTKFLESAPDIEVVGVAHDGQRALELVRTLHPDAVTLDLEMPGMPGLAVLDEIMHTAPTPVTVVSGVSRRAAELTLEALHKGAIDYVLKYSPGHDTDPDQLRDDLIAKVRQAAQVRVIRSIGLNRVQRLASRPGGRPAAAKPVFPQMSGIPGPAGGVVVVGASTGGPPALLELLGRIPAGFPAALVVVQHMPPAFTRFLAEQLDRQVELTTREAAAGDELRAGHVLVAPGDRHLVLTRQGRVRIDDGPKVGGHRPAIDVTMQSAAETFGQRCIGIVLTGMGEDGAAGLDSIQRRGGTTFAQDAASCVINGMPQQAIDRGVVDVVGPPAAIAAHLCKVLSERSNGPIERTRDYEEIAT